MKRDPYKHKERYESWKKEVLEYRAEGVTKENSDILIRYGD